MAGPGRIVGAFTASHSPGISGWPERAQPQARDAVLAGYQQARRQLEELAPDLVIAVSVEHFTNFHLGNLPAFAIATGETYLGPVTAEMAAFLDVEQHEYPGNAAFGRYLYEFALESEFDPALVEGGLDFDENFCVPLKYLDPEAVYPLVPIIVNGVNPPWPTPKRCYDFGRMIRRAVESQSAVERVAVVGTGGLSHWVGLPEAGSINSDFDRDFLARLESGDGAKLTDYTRAEIDGAGNGAHEIRTWLVAAGAAQSPFDVLAYEAVPEWLTGTAVATARL